MGSQTEAALQREMAGMRSDMAAMHQDLDDTKAQMADSKRQMASLAAKNVTQGEYSQALALSVDQETQRTLRFGFVLRAITLASNKYYSVLMTEADKTIDWAAVITFAAFAVLPEFAALGALLSKAGSTIEAVAKTYGPVLKSMNRTINVMELLSHSSTGNDKGFSAANDVLAVAYNNVLTDMSVQGGVIHQVTEGIIDGTIGPQPLAKTRAFFKAANLPILAPVPVEDLVKQSDVLAKMMLYDMLRQYTRQYVSFGADSITGNLFSIYLAERKYGRSDIALADVPSGAVEVRGLNGNQRESIYKEFSTVPWPVGSVYTFNLTTRPPIKDWRSLFLFWKEP